MNENRNYTIKLGTLCAHKHTLLIYKSLDEIQKLVGFSLDLNV